MDAEPYLPCLDCRSPCIGGKCPYEGQYYCGECRDIFDSEEEAENCCRE